MKFSLLATGIGALTMSLGTPAFAGALSPCTITFESGDCPVPATCGATFAGGIGCAFEGLAFCYSGGLRSYKVSTATPLTITLSDDLIALRTFFAHEGPGATGSMTFFDAPIGGSQVGPVLSTNGNCLALMPAFQTVSFSTPVRRIEVAAGGAPGSEIWIDDFQINPCLSDLNFNGNIDFADILAIIGAWGPCGAFCPQDLNGNQNVDFADILIVIAQFGPCP